jgi:hypothetical protein
MKAIEAKRRAARRMLKQDEDVDDSTSRIRRVEGENLI